MCFRHLPSASSPVFSFESKPPSDPNRLLALKVSARNIRLSTFVGYILSIHFL